MQPEQWTCSIFWDWGVPDRKSCQVRGDSFLICTNEPEICDFMTNNLAGEEMTIMKCDKCKDGYLIVKDGRGSGPFLGCTNYKADKTGCNNYVTKDFYLRKYKGQN